MPMWCPPTPPQDDNDIYIDYSVGFLYEQTIMSESQLPQIYIKKEHKRIKVEATPPEKEVSGNSYHIGRRTKMVKKDDTTVNAPRSLFDRPSPALLKMRRDARLQKYRGISRPILSMPGTIKPLTVIKPLPDQKNVPEWLIHEDWILLQTVQVLLELPLNLMVLSPGHTPNWDVVADMVNSVSRLYRSPKQCRLRYESIIVPREEGKILCETNPKKAKKMKGAYKLPQQRSNRPMRTAQLFMQDNNGSYNHLYMQKFDTIKAVSNKRAPTVKPVLVQPSLKTSTHMAVFVKSGISYETPITPIEVATKRAERIAKEKQKSVQAAQVLTAEQLAAQRLQQQAGVSKTIAVPTSQVAALPSVSVASSSPQAVVVGISQPQVTNASQLGTVVSVSGTTVIQTGSVATLTPALRTSRPVTTLTVQEMVAAANQVRASQAGGTTSTPAVVSVANLAQVQAAAQRLASASLVTGAQTGVTTVATAGAKGVVTGTVAQTGKNLNAAQIQYYRQQALLQQQQRLTIREQQLKRLQATQAGVAGAGQKVSVAVTTGTALGVAAAGGATISGVAAVQVSQAQQQQRAQFIKQAAAAAAAGKQTTIARTVSESEMAAILKRQQQKAQVAQVQVPTQAGFTHAQILAQAGLQVQQSGTSGQPSVATLVKTVSAPSSVPGVTIPVAGMSLPQVKATITPGGKTTTATPQQIRQLALHQQLLQRQKLGQPQKVAQLTQVGGKTGVPAQLIVQGQKQLPTTVTVQQIQQVIKQVQPQAVQHIAHVSAAGQSVATQASTAQVISHAVLAKAPQAAGAGATVTGTLHAGQNLQTRVIPVSATQQSLKQTIQVVTAPAAQALASGARTAVPNVTIDSSGRPQVSVASTLASALAGTIKMAPAASASQQQTLLSQVTAALQCQPVSVAVRQSQSPIRIQTSAPATTIAASPLTAVAVQQGSVSSSTVQSVPLQQVAGQPIVTAQQVLAHTVAGAQGTASLAGQTLQHGSQDTNQ